MLLALPLCLTLSAAQCTDPATPTGGFPVTSALDQLVTFSDGTTTRVDARRPSAAPGACGWPVLVLVHGIGGNKSGLATTGQSFAAQGYFSLTFDVRGHGMHSGGHTYFGQRERFDQTELVRWALATFPGVADGSRIGVNGGSQGGIHAWQAAAWSGAPIEANPWGVTGNHPHIDAIVAENTSPDFAANFAPQSLGVHSASGAIILGTGVDFEPGFRAQVDTALRGEDWSGFSALMTDPLRDPFTRVSSITTPTMALMAFDDFAFPAYALAQAWQALPAGTPRKLYLGTGGHQSPANNVEGAFRIGWRKLWLDHFLKGANNGIELGSSVAYGVTPNDTAQYLSSTSTWTRKFADAWPPSGSYDYRMFLRDGAALSPIAPSGAESSETIHQTVAVGFDMNDVVNGGFSLGVVEPNVPRSELEYDSAPLASAIEFAGDARVRLSVSCATTRYQVRASLWDVPPSGAPRYVCGGSHFVFDDVAAGANTFEVRLNSNAYRFEIAHRVRLQLENLQIHQPPTGTSLRFGPYVHPFDLEVRHSSTELSWLDLPVAASLAIVYGTPQPNSQGCTSSMSSAGVASTTSALPFTLAANQVLNQKSGLLFYGFAIRGASFLGGTLWVAPPLARTPVQGSGGNPPPDDCSGAFGYEFNARIQSGVDPSLVTGARVFAQYWSRDPAAPSTTNLTNGVEFSIL